MTPNDNDQYTFHRSYDKFLRDHPPEELSRAIYRQRLIGGNDIERAKLQWATATYWKNTTEWQGIVDQFPIYLQKLARHVVDQVRCRMPVSCPPEYDIYQGSVFNGVVLHVLLAYPKPADKAFERLLSESRAPKPNPVGTGRPRVSSSRLEEADAADDAAALPQLTLRELVATSVPDQERPIRPTRTVAPGPHSSTDSIDSINSIGPILELARMKWLSESDNENDNNDHHDHHNHHDDNDNDDNDNDDNVKEIWSNNSERDGAGDVRPGVPSFPCASILSFSASRVCTPSSSPSP